MRYGAFAANPDGSGPDLVVAGARGGGTGAARSTEEEKRREPDERAHGSPSASGTGMSSRSQTCTSPKERAAW